MSLRSPGKGTVALLVILPLVAGVLVNLLTELVLDISKPWLPWLTIPATVLLIPILILVQARQATDNEQLEVDQALGRATDQLAVYFKGPLEEMEQRLRVQNPFPLTVKWRLASDDAMDFLPAIRRTRGDATGPPLSLDGELRGNCRCIPKNPVRPNASPRLGRVREDRACAQLCVTDTSIAWASGTCTSSCPGGFLESGDKIFA